MTVYEPECTVYIPDSRTDTSVCNDLQSMEASAQVDFGQMVAIVKAAELDQQQVKIQLQTLIQLTRHGCQ